MKYGDKRDYRKIDLYVNGKYAGSTTWAKSLQDAVARYVAKNGLQDSEEIKAEYCKA